MFLQIREFIAGTICPEMETERRELTRLVNVDALTGLANRRAFELALPAAELDPDISVVVFDANNFGKLNKAAGHKFGDIALKEIADVIIKAARFYGSAERAFRIGGDEFVVLIATEKAARLRDAIENGFSLNAGGVEISISGTIGQTFEAADAYIQQRKGQRKNETSN